MPLAPSTRSLLFWLLLLAGVGFLAWVFNPVLFPFVAGIAIAYFLAPAVAFFARHGLARWLGALFVLSAFLFIALALMLLTWPMISTQIGALIAALPDYASHLREQYLPWAQHWLSRFLPEDVEKIRSAATQTTGDAVGWVGHALRGLVSGGFVLLDAVGLAILMPVTAFYVLRDWDKLTHAVDRLIPRKHYDIIREQMAEINQTLSGFLRGQAIVCLFLGLFYSAGLALNGLEYGATVGLVAGVLTIIPYVGTVFGWVTSVLLAAVQFEGDWLRIGLVFAVFAVGQFLEGYVLTPRLVGQRIGLHPVWILFALISGIKLMGFTGALIAVPVAAVVGVLVRFGVRQYQSSSFYK
ncbi:MAG: AI-2E family transporter [Alphaproteobacteria bacterium]|nr:AI-2E family transporter [Alphaproteobacteria bacterium]